MEQLDGTQRLHRVDVPKRDIARSLGTSPSTEQAWRKGLAEVGLLEWPVEDLPELDRLKAACRAEARKPYQAQSTIETWRPHVAELVTNRIGPTAIRPAAAAVDPTFNASVSALKRLVIQIAAERGARPEAMAVPVEPPPGKVAQVYFGYG